MNNRLNVCINSFKESLGDTRIVSSPLVRRFKIGKQLGLFEGAFLGKAFLDSSHEQRLWKYLSRPRSHTDIIRYLMRTVTSDARRIELLKNLHILFDEHFLVYEGTSANTLFNRSSEQFLTFQELRCLYVLPTLECNFTCPHCFITSNLPSSKLKPIRIKDLRRGIDIFYKNIMSTTQPHVRIFGGEPLVRPDLMKEIVRYVKGLERNRILKGKQLKHGGISISTNAALIDREMADWFLANDIGVLISLDGRRKANDGMRVFTSGAGTFDSIMRGIDNLKRSKVRFAIVTTIGRHNIETVERDVKWIVYNVSESISFNIMQEFMVGRNRSVIPRGKLPLLMKVLENLYNYLERKGLMESRYSYLWNNFIEGLPWCHFCASNGGAVAIMPDGSMTPCHHLVHGRGHRIRPRRGMRIQDTRVWRKWQNRTAYSIKTLNEDCPYRLLCAGGCTTAALNEGGGMNGCAKNICELMDFQVRHMMKRCLKMKA